MSSSSSADADGGATPIATLLERAFDLMLGGCPRAYTEMARRLGGSTVRLAVDDEAFDVRVEHDAPRIGPPDGTPTVSVRTTRAAVRAVLVGRRRLVDAVRADEVRADGRLPDLVGLLEALEAFVHGAVRCDKIAQLYDDFQREGAER